MISIIVVGYKARKYLDDCLSSIFSSSYRKFRVIFIDNDSSDGSLEFVQKKFPQVLTIKNSNTGYAGGNNLGIKIALKDKSDFIFLLNPDTILDRECLKTLISESDEGTILQPLVLLHDGNKKTNLINTAGNVLNFLGFSYCGHYRENQSVAEDINDIALASGAATFVPSKILKKIGLFDESFFIYHEDVDLNWRARIYGYNIRLISKAILWHKYSFSKHKTKLYYAERNRLLFLYKNFSLKYLLLISPIFVLNEILIFLYAVFTQWGWQKISASFAALMRIPSLTKSRKSNLNQIKKNEHQIKKFIKSEIAFSEVSSSGLFRPYSIVIGLYWKLIYHLI